MVGADVTGEEKTPALLVQAGKGAGKRKGKDRESIRTPLSSSLLQCAPGCSLGDSRRTNTKARRTHFGKKSINLLRIDGREERPGPGNIDRRQKRRKKPWGGSAEERVGQPEGQKPTDEEEEGKMMRPFRGYV